MIYLPFLFIILLGIISYINQKAELNDIKENGERVMGLLIKNGETGQPNSMFRLGGNINTPVLSFVTVNGDQITGKAANSFTTQFKIPAPCNVFIIYDKRDPTKFLFDGFV